MPVFLQTFDDSPKCFTKASLKRFLKRKKKQRKKLTNEHQFIFIFKSEFTHKPDISFNCFLFVLKRGRNLSSIKYYVSAICIILYERCVLQLNTSANKSPKCKDMGKQRREVWRQKNSNVWNYGIVWVITHNFANFVVFKSSLLFSTVVP